LSPQNIDEFTRSHAAVILRQIGTEGAISVLREASQKAYPEIAQISIENTLKTALYKMEMEKNKGGGQKDTEKSEKK